MSRLAIAFVVLFGLLLPREADAYLDPGTGSAIIQGVIAAVMGGLFVLRLYWRKIQAFFSGREEVEGQAEAESAAIDEHK